VKTLFEQSQKGQKSYSLPKIDPAFLSFEPKKELLRKEPPPLPEVCYTDLTRHFARLARRNVGIDNIFYPLGSCTMKLNPRINEQCARLPSFVRTHPFAPSVSVQGNLEVIEELIRYLCEICGMEAGTLNPNAGAQGEFVGVKMMAAYHKSRGDGQRIELLIPDNAHGTNPASAGMAGFKIVPIRTNSEGDIDLEELKKKVGDQTAGLMLTNPNTLGLFSTVIAEAAQIVHSAGGLLYYDGANLNPILNVVRPGEMGFDVMHVNLHKTFSTPHGGGGPGSGPVLCNKKLSAFLPTPIVSGGNVYWQSEHSIGQISSFFGNFSVYLRAYLYIRIHGHYGLRRIAEHAVLNANYLKVRLSKYLKVPFERACMHEFVVQADSMEGVRAVDIAKRLLDYGFHSPTTYFPLIVKECLLIEPTETESKLTLDGFVEAIISILEEAKQDVKILKNAPHTMCVGRLDEVKAVKDLVLSIKITR